MSNKCLITKLNGIIENDNLPYFDSIIFKLNDAVAGDDYSVAINIATGETATAEIIKGDAVWNSNNSKTIIMSHNSNNVYGTVYKIDVNTSGEVKVKINSKMAVEVILHNSAQFRSKVVWNPEELGWNTTRLYLGNQVQTPSFDIDKLAEGPLSKLIELHLAQCYQAHGSLVSLAKAVNLTNFDLSFTSISGDLNNFAVAMVAAGRTSGTLTAQCGGYITLNGAQQGSNDWTKIITFGSSFPGGYKIEDPQ